jgi:hypothetical protein
MGANRRSLWTTSARLRGIVGRLRQIVSHQRPLGDVQTGWGDAFFVDLSVNRRFWQLASPLK